MGKKRLDILLLERGLAESRSLAQRLVMAGQVRVNGQVVLKPATAILESAELSVDQGPPFVSRGGEKLAAALAAFHISINGRICVDVGASTGGFTDCLLQNGAARVFAIDVGQGILHWKLRQDPRVVVMEDTNARFVERLPEPVSLVTIDASFISLRILLPVVHKWFSVSQSQPPAGQGNAGPGWDIPLVQVSPFELARETRQVEGNREVDSQVVALIKPQFEAGREEVARGDGVIRNPEVHRQVLFEVLTFAQSEGYRLESLIRSPLLGPKGNAEFLAHLIYGAPAVLDLAGIIAAVL